jgi:hypothetical protein
MRHKVQDKLNKLTLQVESISAGEMLDEFRQELHKYFKIRKNQIEDWQDESMEEDLINRLRVKADKNNWTNNDVLEIALICAIVWNNK